MSASLPQSSKVSTTREIKEFLLLRGGNSNQLSELRVSTITTPRFFSQGKSKVSDLDTVHGCLCLCTVIFNRDLPEIQSKVSCCLDQNTETLLMVGSESKKKRFYPSYHFHGRCLNNPPGSFSDVSRTGTGLLVHPQK